MAALCSHCGEFGLEEQSVTCPALEGGRCSPCKERAAVRHQIKQLKAIHDAIGTTINVIHDPFIHKLPAELGSRIFLLSLPTLNTAEHQAMSEPGPDSLIWARPLKLGSVCRKWRQLAWATPQLWTAICIRINLSTTHSMPGLLHEWLGRSGALPLTVYFHTDFGREPLYSDIKAQNALQAAIGSAIDTLNLHSGRWRSLHITASSDAIKRLSCPTILDQLTSLELVITDFSSPADFMTESELNVTHLKLICFPLTSINVRWDMVTHATISEVVLNEALELLRRASNLQYYCVSLSGRRETDPVIPVVNPQLRSLDLWGPHFGTLLSEITLPSLEEWTQDMSRGRPLETMQSFVERSRCRIKMLNLSSPVLVSRALHPLLQKLPSVERIRLHFWITETDEDASIDDILIRIFVSGPENRTPEPFLPHLQLLEWKSSGSPPLSWDLLPIFYSKNNRRSLKLKTFAHESQITNKDAFELLRLEEKEGLDLQIIDEATGEDVLEPWRIGILEASV